MIYRGRGTIPCGGEEEGVKVEGGKQKGWRIERGGEEGRHAGGNRYCRTLRICCCQNANLVGL